jgi:hypothetical protein
MRFGSSLGGRFDNSETAYEKLLTQDGLCSIIHVSFKVTVVCEIKSQYFPMSFMLWRVVIKTIKDSLCVDRNRLEFPD